MIHTVGYMVEEPLTADHERLLESSYQTSLVLAEQM